MSVAVGPHAHRALDEIDFLVTWRDTSPEVHRVVTAERRDGRIRLVAYPFASEALVTPPPGPQIKYWPIECGAGMVMERTRKDRQDARRLLRHWERRWTQFPDAFEGPLSPAAEILACSLPRAARLLVLADGSGRDSTWLAQLGHQVTAVEVSPAAVALARSRAQRSHVSVNHICADAVAWVDTTSAAGPWDGILSVYGHLGQRQNLHVAHRLLRTLTPQGALVVLTSPSVTTAEELGQTWGTSATTVNGPNGPALLAHKGLFPAIVDGDTLDLTPGTMTLLGGRAMTLLGGRGDAN